MGFQGPEYMQRSDNNVQLLISAPEICSNKQKERIKVANEVKAIYHTFKKKLQRWSIMKFKYRIDLGNIKENIEQTLGTET